MEKIIIRKAETGDLKGILALNFDLFKKEKKEFDKSLDMEWTYGRKGRDYFKMRISGKGGLAVVAENDGKIIGYLCGAFKDNYYRVKANYAELENMIVEKKFRGKGIGTKLTKEFFKWCESNKIGYISVTASAKNKPTIDFYRSMGFKDYDLTLEMKCRK